jgi:multidrug efflux pump subunit AcrB
LEHELPQVSAYFQTGGLVDAILNLGMPAPLDIQVSGMDLEEAHTTATEIAQKVRALPGVSDVLVPQDIDYPALKLDIDRIRASELGLNEKEVVGNVITALTSDGMIAPSFWVDPKSGNDYLLTVQYPEGFVKNLADLASVPLRGAHSANPTRLDTISHIRHLKAPTEVDHYQLRRVMDVYVSPAGEDLSQVLAGVQRVLVSEFRFWAHSLHFIGVLDPGGAVRVVPGPVSNSISSPNRVDGSVTDLVVYRHDAECDVVDGRSDDGRDSGVQQHFDSGLYAAAAAGGQAFA